VRDARRLGPERMHVHLASGDLADPGSFRNALRGVRTVVHLAGAERDQPGATIEELDGLAVHRLLRAAERARVRHFAWTTPLCATPHHPSRVHRSKALAAQAAAGASIPVTTFATSLLYAPGDRRLARLERLALLPAVPLTGRGAARAQPLWVEDAADGILAGLDRPDPASQRFELAGPEVLTHRQVVSIVLHAAGRRRRLVPIPLAVLRAALRAGETLAGPTAFATWDEALMLAVPSLADAGPADLERLGVHPRRMAEVLAA
jgi:NADH dehydrogenase